MRSAVFFDRDGVLINTHVRNGKPYAISDVDDLVINSNMESVSRKKVAVILKQFMFECCIARTSMQS